MSSKPYIGQVRKPGYQNWTTVPGKFATTEEAMARAVQAMAGHKRARVLLLGGDYYEPLVVMECNRI